MYLNNVIKVIRSYVKEHHKKITSGTYRLTKENKLIGSKQPKSISFNIHIIKNKRRKNKQKIKPKKPKKINPENL